ncbi:MAG: spore coat associated protein CotJA [Clostridia bacterium]|nr:spore coat associated protein CotJA [Clostridia bacterium]
MNRDNEGCRICGRANGSCGCENGQNQQQGCSTCPVQSWAPSLAMVYSPVQCWEGVLEPAEALANGSLFSGLIKPFEVEMGGRGR